MQWDSNIDSWAVVPSQRRLQRILAEPLPLLPPSMQQPVDEVARALDQPANEQAQPAPARQLAAAAVPPQQTVQAAPLPPQEPRLTDAEAEAAVATKLALLRQPPPGAQKAAASTPAQPVELSAEESRWWFQQVTAVEQLAAQPSTLKQLAAGSAAPAGSAAEKAPCHGLPKAPPQQAEQQQPRAQVQAQAQAHAQQQQQPRAQVQAQPQAQAEQQQPQAQGQQMQSQQGPLQRNPREAPRAARSAAAAATAGTAGAAGAAAPSLSPCCALCRINSEASQALGRLLKFDVSTPKQPGRQAMVHELCAAWAARTAFVGQRVSETASLRCVVCTLHIGQGQRHRWGQLPAGMSRYSAWHDSSAIACLRPLSTRPSNFFLLLIYSLGRSMG